MDQKRNALQVRLPNGTDIVLAELTCSEVMMAVKSSGSSAKGTEVNTELVRYSLRRVGDTEVTYAQLAGQRIREHLPRFRDRLHAFVGWSAMHNPTPEQLEQARAAIQTAETATGETWTVPLPGGREVVLHELDEESVGDAMAAAMQASNGGAGVSALSAIIDGLRRSVKVVDSSPVTPEDLEGEKWDALFSVRETTLLGTFWEEMQTGSAKELHALGEAIRAGGTR